MPTRKRNVRVVATLASVFVLMAGAWLLHSTIHRRTADSSARAIATKTGKDGDDHSPALTKQPRALKQPSSRAPDQEEPRLPAQTGAHVATLETELPELASLTVEERARIEPSLVILSRVERRALSDDDTRLRARVLAERKRLIEATTGVADKRAPAEN